MVVVGGTSKGQELGTHTVSAVTKFFKDKHFTKLCFRLYQDQPVLQKVLSTKT